MKTQIFSLPVRFSYRLSNKKTSILNSDSAFRFFKIRTGNRHLTITARGYHSQALRGKIIKSNIAFQAQVINLASVQISSTSFINSSEVATQ